MSSDRMKNLLKRIAEAEPGKTIIKIVTNDNEEQAETVPAPTPADIRAWKRMIALVMVSCFVAGFGTATASIYTYEYKFAPLPPVARSNISNMLGELERRGYDKVKVRAAMLDRAGVVMIDDLRSGDNDEVEAFLLDLLDGDVNPAYLPTSGQ